MGFNGILSPSRVLLTAAEQALTMTALNLHYTEPFYALPWRRPLSSRGVSHR